MTKENITQPIEFTKKQFLSLLKAVYLGNWMVNAYRTGSKDDPHIQEYESISDFIFSQVPKFGFKRYMDHEPTDGERYFPTRYFEEETDVHKFHEEYDEETFWDQLAMRLGTIDFFEKYSKEEIKKMTREEWFTKFYECVDAVNEKLEESGLEKLKFKE